ncbi:MAG: gliding motility-associated C-terminal domain-containing protein, partial [Saprospirales bacterium]
QSYVLSQPDPLMVDIEAPLSVQINEMATIEAVTNIDRDSIVLISWSVNELAVCDPCDDLRLTFQGDVPSTISVTITDINGCTASAQVFLNVVFERRVYIPNAFSPNNDGINDLFMIYGTETVDEVEVLMVFDRWGEKVFERLNFPVSDQIYGWDGTFNNEKLNPAVFIYFARVRFVDGVTEEFIGEVLLVD